MSINLSGSLAGLSLLSGTNVMADYSAASTVESLAVRRAKAQYTTQEITPPWKSDTGATLRAGDLASVRRSTSIIDKPDTSRGLTADVQAAFTSWKALDRLKLLAERASAATTSSAERAQLAKRFEAGLSELQGYLATAPADQLELHFDTASARATSVKLPAAAATEFTGQIVTSAKTDAVPGLSGQEVFEIKLSKGGVTANVRIDLSTGQQPPSLSSVVQAFNSGIAAIVERNADGTPKTDAAGNPVPVWKIRLDTAKMGEGEDAGWGLKVVPAGLERISFEEVDADSALVIAAGQSALDWPQQTRMFRLDDPASGMGVPVPTGRMSAVDGTATAAAALLPATKSVAGTAAASGPVAAALSTDAMVTDPAGFTWVLGSTAGDVGSNLGTGTPDALLTRLDSLGNIVFQANLGWEGGLKGAALALAPDGDVVLAGTATTASGGQDMLVARYSASGEERWATQVPRIGHESAAAIAVGTDGQVYVGGRASSADGGDSLLVRLNANGTLAERQLVAAAGSGGINALQIEADGSLLVLEKQGQSLSLSRRAAGAIGTETARIGLGEGDASALLVDGAGQIHVGGSTAGSGGRDGLLVSIDSALTSASRQLIASSGADRIDSLAFVDGQLYAGGRTDGALAGDRRGVVDGFVARIEAGGSVADLRQFGQLGARTETVRLAAAPSAGSALSALGLPRGTLEPAASATLVASTGLRPGDSFGLKVNDGSTRTITVEAGDTLTSFADRIRKAAGSGLTVAVVKEKDGSGRTLQLTAAAGAEVQLTASAEGKDALARLGLEPQKITAPASKAKNAPAVSPGGRYGLDLDAAMNLSTRADAAAALKRLEGAISTTQTGFRSLFWNETTEALVNAGTSGSVSAYQQAQLKGYQDALARLTSSSSSSSSGTSLLFGA